MANKNEPKGFEPWGRVRSIRQYVASAITAIYPNDSVMFNSAGKVTVATAGSTQILGVAQSYKTATGTTVLVMDDPDQQYIVMDDASGSTVLVTTHVGNNFDHVATAGNGTLLKSQQTIARGGANSQVTAAAGWRLLGIVGATGANSLCRVVCNEHVFAKKTTGT
jgi:hypothetical protein